MCRLDMIFALDAGTCDVEQSHFVQHMPDEAMQTAVMTRVECKQVQSASKTATSVAKTLPAAARTA